MFSQCRCLKEEYEAKLEEANKQYESVKGKLELAQEKLKGLENHVEKTEERLGKCLAELNQVKQVEFCFLLFINDFSHLRAFPAESEIR